MQQKGVIFDIKHFAIHDGPGIRTTVFLKGCPMNCWWCHNPESQNQEPEEMKLNSNRISKRSELIGKEITVDEILLEILKDRIFFEESSGGVTFSGGEPLFQIDFLQALLKKCKKEGLHTAVDTAGCTDYNNFEKIIDYVDLFLYDLKLIDEKKHIKYTGQSNLQILENLKLLSKNKKPIIIRLPIIPSINDSEEELEKIADFIRELEVIRVELLNYHTIGEEKYKRLNKINRMENIQPLPKNRLIEIKQFLEKFGLEVTIEE